MSAHVRTWQLLERLLYQNYFMKYENVSIACELLESPETIAEMEKLIRAILKDNISFAARNVKTKQLVGMCINKMVNPSANITLDEVFDSFKTENMKAVGNYLHYVEYTYDISKEWQIDCWIELSFLATRTEYGRRGIALALSEYLMEYAKKLKDGHDEEVGKLPDHIKDQRPGAITAAFTSRFSQKIGEKLQFETLFEVENSELSFRGISYAAKIDPIHKYSRFAAKKL
ncbi:uncharacterized protein LOC101901403 isoform X2 [Musca domestica]|uniref:Uncharacterized protein LOC101901403 isoform X2 n=1 Tax=Musca domestica TaxID=7370 RepID=A0ABM3V0J4_MUSDO|nr:uncharacterized protein LOC101901403 isoform X2 [Musca domestica]